MSGARPPAYTPTPDQLAAIARRAGLGSPASVRPAPGGMVNPVLILDDRAVLRVNVRQAGDPKVAKEAWVLGLLAGAPPPLGARVPRVLAADTSRTILPYDYLLLDYLPGRVGDMLWPECDAATRAALSQQMGAMLARLHAFPLPGQAYGGWNPTTGSLGTVEDYQAMLSRRIADLLADMQALRALPPAQIAAIAEWLAAHAGAIPAHPRRALIHGDFGLWNMMVEPAPPGPRVSAVFDFEWSEAGPPALDFVPIFFEAGDPIDPAAFIDGYTGGQPLDQTLLQQAHVFQMLYHLDLLGVVHRHWGGERGALHEACIAQLLRGEPMWGLAAAGYGWPF